MAGWQDLLRAAPPEPLTADQAAAIRRAAVAVAATAALRPTVRQAPALLIAGALTSAVTAAVFVAASTQPAPSSRPQAAPAAAPVVKQLQFATPGGTRIIWHFNPSFTLQETLP
jgi:hypothetical protein